MLAGGAARRMAGRDKPGIEIDGATLLDRVIAATKEAERVIVVGPERRTATDVQWVRERPPGGGPVAAISAAMSQVAQPWCLVLAADLPWIAPAIPLLLRASRSGDVAVLSSAGRRNHLAAAWPTHALRGALGALTAVENAAARELFRTVQVVEVPDGGGWGQDCDTWDDVERARERAVR